jgi:HEAT repeat protein
LNDASSRVRSSAADALAKIRDPRAGPALYTRLELPEPSPDTARMILAALGAVGYGPAVPRLLRSLGSNDASERATAAWSLGALFAAEALPDLQVALQAETDGHARERMREAIRVLRATY